MINQHAISSLGVPGGPFEELMSAVAPQTLEHLKTTAAPDGITRTIDKLLDLIEQLTIAVAQRAEMIEERTTQLEHRNEMIEEALRQMAEIALN